MSRSVQDLPANGPINGTRKKPAHGKTIQIRHYGPDGRAKKNIDFGHDHGGQGDPHAQDWDWSKNPPRQKARAILPGE
jgi:hypothetical protein